MSNDWQDIYAGNEEAAKQAAEELKRKMSKHRQKVIDSLELNGEFLMLEDGYQYFAPRSGAGVISARELRIIADELDRRNQKWDEQVKRDVCPPSR